MARTDTSHFFVGRFPSERSLAEFLEEDYSIEDDDVPVSRFYGSQGETFCDHDSMEGGFREGESTLKEFFEPYSYAEHWAEELASRAIEEGLKDANVLVFISKSEIESPRSVTDDEFMLTYLGEIEYPI